MSSGGSWRDHQAKRLEEALPESVANTERSGYESAVNEALADELSESIRDTDLTNERLDEIISALGEEVSGRFDLLLGGSAKKRTYIDGLSDVDVLVCVDKTELADKSPREILEFLQFQVSGIANVKEVGIGDLALTIIYQNGDVIQLLPALRKGEGLKIQEEGSNKWSSVIRPDRFATKLTEANQELGGKLIPAIKIAKMMVSELPENQRPTGYHMESMAIEAFKNAPSDLPRTKKTLVTYFFDKARSIVLKQIGDPTGQSYKVDEYLGTNDSSQRKQMSYLFDRIYKRMKRADEANDVSSWKEMLGS